MNASSSVIPTNKIILRMITTTENAVPCLLSSSFSAKADNKLKPPDTTPPKRNPSGISICPLNRQNIEAKKAIMVAAKVKIAVTIELENFSKSFFII